MKNILDKCGMSNIGFDENLSLDVNWVKSSIGLRLDDIAMQDWRSREIVYRLYTNYRIFKTVHRFEKYLVKFDFADRINLCKFRCGNHRLPALANGRYLPNQVPQGCNLCESQEPGDEFHFLFNIVLHFLTKGKF